MSEGRVSMAEWAKHLIVLANAVEGGLPTANIAAELRRCAEEMLEAESG